MEEPMSNKVRIIAFLGPTNYKEVTYCYQEITKKTRFCQSAIVDILVGNNDKKYEVTSITILCTRKAYETNFEKLKSEIEENHSIKICYELIPDGADQKELREIFSKLFEEMNKTKDDETLVIDITHGFRSQPFFCAAVICFMRAFRDNPFPIKVFYAGSLPTTENKESEVPIWEITEFIDVIDWANALNLFIRSGRTDYLTNLVKQANAKETPMNQIAIATEQFGEAFQTLRVGSLLLEPDSLVVKMDKKIGSAKQAIEKELPPLAKILDKLQREIIKPISCDNNLLDEKGKKALYNLAMMYYKMGRYLEAVILIREAFITTFASKEEEWRPNKIRREEREKVEERCRETLNGIFGNTIGQLRNDLAHAGFNDQPRKPKTIKENIDNALKKYRLWSNIEKGCFLNISNHPSKDWDLEQREKALELGEPIIDLSFPEIDPSWDIKEMEKACENIIEQVPDNASFAMVMGEHSFTHMLVRKLQALGVRCVVATTQRDVESEGEKKISKFKFVRFREYPMKI